MRIWVFDCRVHEQDIREVLAPLSSDDELDGSAS